MKTPVAAFIALVMCASAFSQTSAPPAPALTAGAEFKGLRFDWDTVPDATWYQLEYRAHQTGAFVQQGDDFPATATSTHFSFPLHLFDWTYARYRLAACNSAGCSRSDEVSVSNLRRDAVGYFKSSSSVPGGQFGFSVDLSPDGYTLVTTATGEPTPISGPQKGRIYVFRRGSDGQWLRRARLDARTDTTYNNYVELLVAVSASGNTVAVTMPYQGISSADARRGQVDIYHWKNNVYTPTRFPRGAFDDIYSADLDDSGYVLVVQGRVGSDGVTAIYKSTNGVWVNVKTVTGQCWNVKVTPDGKKVLAICRSPTSTGLALDFVRVLSGTNWSTRTDIELDFPDPSDTSNEHSHKGFGFDRTGNTIAVHTGDEGQVGASGKVRVFQWDGSEYQLITQLNPGAWDPGDYTVDFGETVSISGDGHTMAIGYSSDWGRGLGPRAAPLLQGSVPTGGVYVYRLTDSWKLANMVKPNYVNPNEYGREFGKITALSGTGKTLVVAVPGEDSSANGIGGNWANSGASGAGALFMY